MVVKLSRVSRTMVIALVALCLPWVDGRVGQAQGGGGPALASATVYGGAGNTRGTAIVIDGMRAYLAATREAGGHGLLIAETVPPGGPLWSAGLDGAHFNAVSANALTLYPVGGAEAAHGARPGVCGASDSSGDHERKSMFGRFDTAGNFLGCSSLNYFPYRGHEGYNAVLAVEEGGLGFVYAAGQAEQTGFARSLPFVMTKYTEAGEVVGTATEPGIVLGTFQCCPGESSVLGLARQDGFLYLAGHSRLTGFGEDNIIRPVLMKYDSLERIWKRRLAGVGGFFRAVTSHDGHLVAVGQATIAGQTDYLAARYDTDGNLAWSVSSGGGGTDILTGVVSVGSRLFAVGHTTSAGAGGVDAVVLEIDPVTGATLSTTLFGGAHDDFANGAATDGADIYVVGESRSFASVDGNEIGQNDVMLLRYVLNRPPVADAGDDQRLECAGHHGTAVALDGTGSSDPDGDALTYTWTGPFGTAMGATPVVTLPLGTHTITLTVDDGRGGTDSDTVQITVEDTTPPALTVSLSPALLWPPNHKLVPIAASVEASDACDPAPVIELVSITSSEPDHGLGDGDHPGDIQDAAFGTPDTAFRLRAERAGGGTGRVYTVRYRARDASGNSVEVGADVVVPHDRRK